MVKNMLTKFRRRIDENFKEIEKIKEYHTEVTVLEEDNN